MYQHNRYELLELEINKLKVVIEEKDDQLSNIKEEMKKIIENNKKIEENIKEKEIYINDLKEDLKVKDEIIIKKINI